MKRILLIIIILASGIWLNASEWQKLLDLEHSGRQNADLYYNIGVGYWQSGQSGMANLYFLRALNLDSDHRAARENLDYVIELSPDKSLYPQRQFLANAFARIAAFLTLNRLAIIALALLALFAVAWVWLLYYDPDKERGLPELVMGILLFLFISFSGILGLKAYRLAYNNKAVVVVQQEFLRKDSRSDAEKLGLLHEAAIVQILRIEKDRCMVRSPDGSKGWLPASALERVRK